MDINILEHIVNIDFDVKPFIKDSIIKQVKVLDRLRKTVHTSMIILSEYSYMFDEGHSLQSL
jgi:hypothetical protein